MDQTVFVANILLGVLVAATGSAAGIWLPDGAALMIAGLAICRICWIEDNIHHDLLPAKRIPTGYRACRNRRRSLFGKVVSDRTDDADSPLLLASELRVQSHAWAAFAWALIAGSALGQGSPAVYVGASIALALSLRHADYLAWSQTVLAGGRPLPRRQLVARGPLARLAYSSRRPD